MQDEDALPSLVPGPLTINMKFEGLVHDDGTGVGSALWHHHNDL